MNTTVQCRCCLERPPDKDLKANYEYLGDTEIYADMLKECFEIHLTVDSDDDSGICDICIARLRDAFYFKQQVLKCQKDFLLQMAINCKDETHSKVKEEISDLEDDQSIYYLALKDEVSDYDLKNDDEDDRNLAEILNVSRSLDRKTDKKRPKKRKTEKHSEKKSKKVIGQPLKLALRTLSKITLSPRSSIQLVNENAKHKLNVQHILKYSNCTPFSNRSLAGLACAYCKQLCPDIHQLRTHAQDKHAGQDLDSKRSDKNNISIKVDITDLQCKICNTPIDHISNLKKHLTKEHDIKFYPDIHDYILEFKLDAGDMFPCALCHSTFETFKMLLQHMNGHYRNYICEVCDMGFINKHRLKNHQRIHDIGTFKCNFCEKVFNTRVRKMCHEKYTHNTNARYTTNCPHCDESFTSYYQRNRHMFKDHNALAASYRCNICDKSFILKSKLTSHIKKVHLMERNHICRECGQGFFIKQSLDEHMIKHNGERVFKCTVCLKAYARKKTLREHMRIHNNDRRFKCGLCSLAFVQKCSLKSHLPALHGITLAEYESARTDLNPKSF